MHRWPWALLTHGFGLANVQIEKAQIMYDPHSREPRGFAFVTMDRNEDAEAAITGMNGVELLGRVLNVEKVSTLDVGHAGRNAFNDAENDVLVLLACTGSPRSRQDPDPGPLLRPAQEG